MPWNVFTLGFHLQNSNHCSDKYLWIHFGLDQLRTGRACGSFRDKAFNKTLSIFSQCVSCGIVVTKRAWLAGWLIPDKPLFFLLSFSFFLFFFTFSLLFSYCSFVLFLYIAQFFSIYKFSSLLPDLVFPFNFLLFSQSPSQGPANHVYF